MRNQPESHLGHYLWASPNTALGLLFAPTACFTAGGIRVVDGVVELHSPVIAWVLRHCVLLPGGAAAMTLGHVVIGRNARMLAATRGHERVHVVQRWGPLFLPADLMAAVWGLVTRAGAYEGNYFEREAVRGEQTPGRPV